MEVFNCQKCGHCCEGKGGIILTAKDLQRICHFLKLDENNFIINYTEKHSDKIHLIADSQGVCVFFKRGIGCGIHPAKPDVCRAWPFFRGNLQDEISLQMAKEFCPGINPRASFAEFCKAGEKYIKTYSLSHSGSNAPNALNIPIRE